MILYTSKQNCKITERSGVKIATQAKTVTDLIKKIIKKQQQKRELRRLERLAHTIDNKTLAKQRQIRAKWKT